MRRKVYDFIRTKGRSSATDIQNALNIDGVDVLKILENLNSQGLTRICPPIPLGLNNDCSCYYIITTKEYYSE